MNCSEINEQNHFWQFLETKSERNSNMLKIVWLLLVIKCPYLAFLILNFG